MSILMPGGGLRRRWLALLLSMLRSNRAAAFGVLLSTDDAAEKTRNLSLCPIRHGPTEAVQPTEGVTLTIDNSQNNNLELLFFDGREETRYWVVDARGSFTVGTRGGDTWRLRMKSGELAAELRVGPERVQRMTIPHCLPTVQEAEAVAAMKLDVPLPTSTELEQCAPWAHLSSSEPSPGMHVVCVMAPTLAVFADGWTGGAPSASRPLPSHAFALPATSADSIASIARVVMHRLQSARRGPLHNAPAFYLPTGERLESAEALLAAPCVLLFEGGMWIWPAIEVGHTRSLLVDDGLALKNVTLTTLSLFPRALLASDVITEEEAELIIRRADGHVRYLACPLLPHLSLCLRALHSCCLATPADVQIRRLTQGR